MASVHTLVAKLPKEIFLIDISNTDFPLTPLPLSTGIVEAKIKCNDYIRAATTGTNAYGRSGLVSPVVSMKHNPSDQNIEIHYLGTTSSMFSSQYFSKNPLLYYDLKRADSITSIIEEYTNNYRSVCLFERHSIERDENASGLWFLRLENSFPSSVDAALWINRLTREQ